MGGPHWPGVEEGVVLGKRGVGTSLDLTGKKLLLSRGGNIEEVHSQ